MCTKQNRSNVVRSPSILIITKWFYFLPSDILFNFHHRAQLQARVFNARNTPGFCGTAHTHTHKYVVTVLRHELLLFMRTWILLFP
jgi:hypothetical protein